MEQEKRVHERHTTAAVPQPLLWLGQAMPCRPADHTGSKHTPATSEGYSAAAPVMSMRGFMAGVRQYRR